ncbi:hypothetical protein [Pseudomonas sp. 22 E 5]|nr:hypothetical protein [Pseudomonas sp. 22 E 5]
MRQRVTPAKPQPTIHFHRAGAIQPGPLKRQDPIQRAIGERQQLLARDHRHRAAVSGRLVRRLRRIPSRILPNSRRIIHMFLAHQHRPLGLVPHHRHRVGNHLIPSLQRHIRNRPNRRRRATQQHGLGRFDMHVQPRPDQLIGQHRQPLAHPTRLDMPQHLHTQPNLHAHAPCRPDQKQIDQNLAGNLAHQFIHIRRR